MLFGSWPSTAQSLHIHDEKFTYSALTWTKFANFVDDFDNLLANFSSLTYWWGNFYTNKHIGLTNDISSK